MLILPKPRAESTERVLTGPREAVGPTVHGREPGMALKGHLRPYAAWSATGCRAPITAVPAIAAIPSRQTRVVCADRLDPRRVPPSLTCPPGDCTQSGRCGSTFSPSQRSLQRTPRWREMDSNFRFRVRCKPGLRRKSSASAACRRRLSGAAGAARDKGFALRLRAEGHRRQTFSVMASTPGGRFDSFNRSTTRASRHVPRAGPALGTALSGASLPWSRPAFAS